MISMELDSPLSNNLWGSHFNSPIQSPQSKKGISVTASEPITFCTQDDYEDISKSITLGVPRNAYASSAPTTTTEQEILANIYKNKLEPRIKEIYDHKTAIDIQTKKALNAFFYPKRELKKTPNAIDELSSSITYLERSINEINTELSLEAQLTPRGKIKFVSIDDAEKKLAQKALSSSLDAIQKQIQKVEDCLAAFKKGFEEMNNAFFFNKQKFEKLFKEFDKITGEIKTIQTTISTAMHAQVLLTPRGNERQV